MRLLALSALLLTGCAVKAPVMHTLGTSWGSDSLVQSEGATGGSLLQALPEQRFERRMDQQRMTDVQMERLDVLRGILEDKELEDRGPLGMGPLGPQWPR